MDAALARVVARQEIADVVARYARGIDRLDLDLVRSCYHPGARDDHGTFKGTVEDFVEWLPGQLARFESTMHFLGNHLVEFDADPDVAHVETYCVAYHRLTERLGDSIAGVRYLDRFERRDGAWRIADRVVVVEWNRLDDIVALGFHADYTRGTRDRTDPVYSRASAASRFEVPGDEVRNDELER